MGQWRCIRRVTNPTELRIRKRITASAKFGRETKANAVTVDALSFLFALEAAVTDHGIAKPTAMSCAMIMSCNVREALLYEVGYRRLTGRTETDTKITCYEITCPTDVTFWE